MVTTTGHNSGGAIEEPFDYLDDSDLDEDEPDGNELDEQNVALQVFLGNPEDQENEGGSNGPGEPGHPSLIPEDEGHDEFLSEADRLLRGRGQPPLEIQEEAVPEVIAPEAVSAPPEPKPALAPEAGTAQQQSPPAQLPDSQAEHQLELAPVSSPAASAAPAPRRQMPWDLIQDDEGDTGYVALDAGNTDYIAYVLAENAQSQGVNLNDFDIIKVPTGGNLGWTVPAGDGYDVASTVKGVIVHIAYPRGWWKKSYDDPENTGNMAPDCSSDDSVRGFGIRQLGPVMDTEASWHDCAACPLNDWNTGRNGGKACKEKRMLYLLQKDSVMPVAVQIPAMSIKDTDRFVRNFSKGRDPRPYWQVETELHLEKDISNGMPYSRVVGNRGEPIPFRHVGRIERYRNSVRSLIATTGVTIKAGDEDS